MWEDKLVKSVSQVNKIQGLGLSEPAGRFAH